MSEIKIASRLIGDGHPCYIIAEMSANHGGSLEKALAIVRAAKEAGADAIKLQTYTPDTMTIDCDNEYFRLGDHPLWGGKTLYQLYGEAMTPWEWHAPLKKEADRVGLHFISTPFDETAVDFLEQLQVPAYKIASFELVDDQLLKKVAATGKPVILSTGMASREEIAYAVDVLRGAGAGSIALLKCVSAYPADPQQMNLALIRCLRDDFKVVAGLSDHTLSPSVAVSAVALGAKIIEKHFILSHSDSSPDVAFSVDPAEFRRMAEAIRVAEKAVGAAVYGRTAQEESSIKFRRSIFVVKDIKQGEIFTEENLRVIRPGYGLLPRELFAVLGKPSTRTLSRGTPLMQADVGR